MNRLKLVLLAMIGVVLLSACQTGGDEKKSKRTYMSYEGAGNASP